MSIPNWKRFHKKLETIDVEKFFDDPVIQETMFLTYGRQYFTEKAKKIYNDYDTMRSKISEHPLIQPTLISDSTSHQLLQLSLLMFCYKSLNNAKIIEVGSGYGGLCRLINLSNDIKSYTCVDDKSLLRILNNFCDDKYNQNFHSKLSLIDKNDNKAFDSIKNEKFDLFISIYCLSELKQKDKEKYLDIILPNCKSAYIIDGDQKTPLFESIILKKLNQYFDIVHTSEYPAFTYQKIKIFSALKKTNTNDFEKTYNTKIDKRPNT